MAYRSRMVATRLLTYRNLSGVIFKRKLSAMAWYNEQLQRSPMIVKSLTSGVLFGVGDVIAQLIVKKKEEAFDWARTARASFYGTVVFGPLAHLHFNFLEWLTQSKLRLTGAAMAFTKTVIDQFTYWTPSINVIYLFTLPLLGGQSFDYAKKNVCEHLWPILKVNWLVWPFVQIANFAFIPVAHQLNFVLAVSLLWVSFLSWKTAHQKEKRRQ